MQALELILRGAVAGLAISAPVGPVNVLCVSRTITKGPWGGIVSGLGAAAADTLYGSIAGFGISLIIDWLVRELFWIRLVGGLLLIAIGVVYYCKRPTSLKEAAADDSHGSNVATAFLLTLTNPTTILSFLAVLAVLGLGQHRPFMMTVFLVAGIFIGAMAWWTLLAMVSGHFRKKFDDRAVVRMNRIAAGAIGAFGLITMAMAIK